MTLVDDTWDREPEIRPQSTPIASDAYGRPREIGSMAGFKTPFFEGRDIAGCIAAAAMLLGPLVAYAVGFGA